MRKSTLFFLVILFLFLAFALFVKLPNSIKVESQITTKNPPEIIFAPFSGKLSEILIQNDAKVNKGDLLVKFQTVANYAQVDTLAYWLANENLSVTSAKSLYNLGPLSLENLQQSFSSFQKNLMTFDFNTLQLDKKTSLNLDSLKSQQKNLLREVMNWKQRHMIKSPATGKIYLPTKNKEGQFLRGGEFICSIIPIDSDQSVIAKVTYLTKGDSELIKVGNFAKLHVIVNGVAQEIEAIVEKINPIILSDQQSGSEVILSLPNNLKTNIGETIAFKQGMSISTTIEARNQTILQKLFK